MPTEELPCDAAPAAVGAAWAGSGRRLIPRISPSPSIVVVCAVYARGVYVRQVHDKLCVCDADDLGVTQNAGEFEGFKYHDLCGEHTVSSPGVFRVWQFVTVDKEERYAGRSARYF